MSEAHKYQQVSAKSPGSASMKDQEGVNEIPSSHQDGSDDDVPLPQQGFAVIHQQGDSDEGGGSSDEGEDQMQNGGYQLLSQEGPDDDDDDESTDHPTSVPSSTNAPTGTSATGTPSYDPEMLQQIASLSTSGTSASTLHPHLPGHLATLMPTQVPQPDQAARVSYSDTKEVREHRKKQMAGDDQIKAAMAGFKLPSASAPQWANFVSEEDWKNNLGSSLSSGGKNAGRNTRQLGLRKNRDDKSAKSDSKKHDTADR